MKPSGDAHDGGDAAAAGTFAATAESSPDGRSARNASADANGDADAGAGGVTSTVAPGVKGGVATGDGAAAFAGSSGNCSVAAACGDNATAVARWSRSGGYAGLSADIAALLDDDEPLAIARAARAATGRVPISFALPMSRWRTAPSRSSDASAWLPGRRYEKDKQWGTVVPGDSSTYVFQTEAEYMADYGRSWLAHTWKEAGWDCMRHLEIIGAGAIPVFRDASGIPPFVMTLYPKRLLAHIEAEHARADVATRAAWREALLRWGAAHLTGPALVEYMAAAAGTVLTPRSRVVFIDAAVATGPDYLSMMMLIGLVEALGGAAVDVLHEPAYLYADAPRNPGLYGRGFNYAGAIPALARTQPAAGDVLRDLAAGAYDVVVYGSFGRSREHADVVLRAYPAAPARVWLLDGEDEASGWWRTEPLAKAATVFVRELVQ